MAVKATVDDAHDDANNCFYVYIDTLIRYWNITLEGVILYDLYRNYSTGSKKVSVWETAFSLLVAQCSVRHTSLMDGMRLDDGLMATSARRTRVP
jgi:hypothetical protein